MPSCTCFRASALLGLALLLLLTVHGVGGQTAAPSLPTSLPSSVSSLIPSGVSSLLPSSVSALLPSTTTTTTSSVLPSLANLSSPSSSSSSSSSSYTLFGTSAYTGSYTSDVTLMSSSLPSFWRLTLTLPPSTTPSLVEAHLLLSSNPTQSFLQPPATSAANGGASFGSAAYSPITYASQLTPFFPASNAALNYSLSSSASQSLLSALFGASSTQAVQLNYLMVDEGAGEWDLSYVAFQPYLNQSLWYYCTLHTDAGGLDTAWTQVTAEEGIAASPPVVPAAVVDDGDAVLLDNSAQPVSATVVYEDGFAWEAGVVKAPTSTGPPLPPGPAAAVVYRIAFATNTSEALLWLNVDWQVDGGAVVHAAMSALSSTQWVSPSFALTSGDALTYNFTWWALADNAEVVSPVVALYRLPTTDAADLTAQAAAGASKLPGGVVLGDGQSLWGNIAASMPSLSSLAAPTGLLGTLPASSSSSSTSASVVNSISSGLTSLLTSLSTLQEGPASVIAPSSVGIQSTPGTLVQSANASVVSTAGSGEVQSFFSMLTPLSIVGSLVGSLTPSTTSLSSLSTYVNSAFCVLPCASASETTDVMVSCLGGCIQPFLPDGLSSGEATSVINGLHDYLISTINAANASSSTSASSSTTAPPASTNSTAVNATVPAATNATAAANSTGVAPAAASTASAGLPGPPAVPSSNAALASAVAQWLLSNAASTTSGLPSLFTPSISSLGGALSTGLGALSSPLLAGLSTLGTDAVHVQSNATAQSVSISSGASSVTVPISALVSLLSPLLLPVPPSPSSVGAAATYIGGLTCMLPCITSATVGVQGTSTCLGGCLDAVVPNAGSDGAALINYVASIFDPLGTAIASGGAASTGAAVGSATAGGNASNATGNSSATGAMGEGSGSANSSATGEGEQGLASSSGEQSAAVVGSTGAAAASQAPSSSAALVASAMTSGEDATAVAGESFTGAAGATATVSLTAATVVSSSGDTASTAM